MAVHSTIAHDRDAPRVVELEIHPAGTRDRDPIQGDVGDRSFRDRPHNAGAFGPAGSRGGGDIAERDVAPKRRGAGDGLGVVRSGWKRGRIRVEAGHEEGIEQDPRHGDVGISEVVDDTPPVTAGLPTNAILGSGKGTAIHQQIAYPTLGITPDGESMPRSKGAIADGDPLAIVRTSPDLDHVVPVTDITILDEIILAPEIDPIGIGGGPGRRDAQAAAINVVHGTQKLDMELGGILHREPDEGGAGRFGKINHGGRAIVGIAIVEIGPPGGALAVQGPGAVEGDVRQVGPVNETRVLGKSPEGQHPQGPPRGDLEGHVALEGNRPAQEGSRRDHDGSPIPHRVDGGLDGGGVIGASRGGVVGGGSDVDDLGGTLARERNEGEGGREKKQAGPEDQRVRLRILEFHFQEPLVHQRLFKAA